MKKIAKIEEELERAAIANSLADVGRIPSPPV